MDNPFKAVTSDVKEWVQKEIRRGKLEAQILQLKLELELSEANHQRLAEKLSEIESKLDKES